nr:tetratricopeptide repeat protein [Okeania sp. SIO3I5]
MLWRSGKLDDAFKKYKQSIESNPNFAWSYYYLGEILAAQNKWQEAVIQYKEAVIALRIKVRTFLNPVCAA